MSTGMATRLQDTFGERVRARRLILEWTQAELSEKTGIGQKEISEIELGQHSPTLKTVEKLAKALEIDASKLLR